MNFAVNSLAGKAVSAVAAAGAFQSSGPSANGFDINYIPTIAVFLAANCVAANACKTKFFTTSAANLLMWGLINFSICYANTLSTRVIGDATFATVDKLGAIQIPGNSLASNASGGVPSSALFSVFNVAYHGALSVLASSIVLAGGAGDLHFLPLFLFQIMWTIGVYVPMTHWQSATGPLVATLVPGASGYVGWLSASTSTGFGVLDHGAAHHVHIIAGVSSGVLTFLIGDLNKRVEGSADYTAAFWTFFAFTGYIVMGDPNSASGGSGPALLNILFSVAAGILTTTFIDVGVHQTFSTVGIYEWHRFGMGTAKAANVITGMNYGLIAMTAGASLISPMWALFFGFFTTLYCYIVSELIVARYFPALGWNSTFSLHFLGAATSSALTGLFASGTFNANIGNQGSFYGNAVQIGKQCAGISVGVLIAAVGTVAIFFFVSALAKAMGGSSHPAAAEGDKPLSSAA